MARSRIAPPLASPDDIEQQFYEALQRGDIDRLMAVWSDDEEISCVHPGGPRVVGAGAIRAAFEAIFANGAVHAQPEKVRRLQTHASAVHSVLETHPDHDERRAAVGLGRRDQRLPERRAGLAPGGAPRQPRLAARGAGDRRGCVGAPLVMTAPTSLRSCPPRGRSAALGRPGGG